MKYNENRMSVEEAAEIMGITKELLRKGIRTGALTFGREIPGNGKRSSYYISRPAFNAFINPNNNVA